jgi:hypothetical protein
VSVFGWVVGRALALEPGAAGQTSRNFGRYPPEGIAVNLFDESALRAPVSEEVRRALREELSRAPSHDEFLPVADAARIAAVHADTNRAWIAMGTARPLQRRP